MTFETELKNYQRLVDEELSRLCRQKKLNHHVRDYLLRGGKRLRPILCMKAYETVTGKKHKRIISPALALELFHVSTLIHDDIMDEDAKRRKKASMHKLYEKHFLSGNKEKEYSGDIFSKESVSARLRRHP
jgi:geranylgeranyl pyrophosphate synthase